jgi:hypothetical protein
MKKINLIILLVVLFSCTENTTKKQQFTLNTKHKNANNQNIKTENQESDIKEVKELTLSDEEYQRIFTKLKTPEFKRLRTVMNACFNDNQSKILKLLANFEVSQSAIDSILYYKNFVNSKFVLLGGSSFIGGGTTYEIVFVDTPNLIFDVWIYSTGEIRSFSKVDLTAIEQKQILVLYRKLIKDKIHNL